MVLVRIERSKRILWMSMFSGGGCAFDSRIAGDGLEFHVWGNAGLEVADLLDFA